MKQVLTISHVRMSGDDKIVPQDVNQAFSPGAKIGVVGPNGIGKSTLLRGGADWFWFEGNFTAYEQNKAARLGEDAARPHRVTYRKLSRYPGASAVNGDQRLRR